MFKRRLLLFLCLTLLLLGLGTAPSLAYFLHSAYPPVQLSGLTWSAKSDPIFFSTEIPEDTIWIRTHFAMVSNEQVSTEKIYFTIYHEKDRDHPVLQGFVEPGKSVGKEFIITKSGNYYLKIACAIPPGIYYFFPPCKGVGKVY